MRMCQVLWAVWVLRGAPTGGRAGFCLLRHMAGQGLDPLLPLGGRAGFSLFVTWPAKVWTRYYP